MKNLSGTLTRYSKFIAAIIGAITEAVNLGYVPHVAQNYVSMAVTILTALGVVGVSNGPAMADGIGIANDLASLRDQIGPLPKKGGIMSVTEALGKTVVEKRQEIAAIGEAIKADIEDLWNHKAQASFEPPKLTTGPTADTAPTGGQVTIHEPETVQTVPVEPVAVPDPTSVPDTSALTNAAAELAKLVP